MNMQGHASLLDSSAVRNVVVDAAGAVTVSGTVTATPGAVGAGTAAAAGRVTLASDDPAVASLGVMDDWDETDRAKVNIIVGQAGVAAGSGAADATTQRIISASDSPDVTSLATLVAAVKAEDVAGADGDSGLVVFGRRNDSNTSRTGTDGDYGLFSQDAAGNSIVVGPVADNGVAGGNPVLVAGKFNAADQYYASGDVANIALDVNGFVKVSGASINNQTINNNPLAVGARVQDTLPPAAGDDGRNFFLSQTSRGQLRTVTDSNYGHPNNATLGTITMTATGATDVIAAAGASTRNVAVHYQIANTSATGVRVDILDGATVKFSVWVPATSTVVGNCYVRSTANTALRADCSASVTDLRISLQGYTSIQ